MQTEYHTSFALSDESIGAFKKFQQSKLVRTSRDSADISFNSTVQFPDNSPQQITLSIDLQLEAGDGYFTLFDGVYLDFEEASKSREAGE